jgi:hypothetical protein
VSAQRRFPAGLLAGGEVGAGAGYRQPCAAPAGDLGQAEVELRLVDAQRLLLLRGDRLSRRDLPPHQLDRLREIESAARRQRRVQ